MKSKEKTTQEKLHEELDSLKNVLVASAELANGFKMAGNYSGNLADRLRYYVDQLFLSSPWKVGDHVKLSRAFVTDDKNHGWYYHQQNMKKGAACKIFNVSHHSDTFCYQVVFDKEVWIDTTTLDEIPVEDDARRLFSFWGSDWFEAIEDE